MSDVFISYSRVDKAFVQKLHHSLSELERDVWVDWEDIPPTADWWNEIKDGIDSADTFVFVISPDSARSPVCYEEVNYAVSQNKRFVPVLYRDVDLETDHPTMHPVISTHNWVFFRDTDNFMHALQTLLQAVETDLGYVRKHTQLLVQARDWLEHNRGTSYLLDGQQIAVAEQWLAESINKKPDPTELHIEFITASRDLEDSRQRRVFAGVLVALFISIALAIFGFVQFLRATDALGVSESRGTQVAFEVTNVAAAQATAVFNYNQVQTQEFLANDNANKALTAQFNAENSANFARTQEARAQNLLVTSEFQGGQIALEVTNVAAAQATAVFNAAIAQTQQFNAENNAQFAQTQEARAQNLLVTSEFQGEQIAFEVTNVYNAQATAVFNAAIAQTQQFNAENSANFARTQEFRAQNLLTTAEFQGTQIALEVTNVSNAQATAEFNAAAAQTQQFNAEDSANFARTQEFRAQNLLTTAEFQGTQIALEVTNVYNAQATAVFNAAIAQTQQFNAENSANFARTQEFRAQNLLTTAEFQGTQIAFDVTNVYNAQATSEFNAQIARFQQEIAEDNANNAQTQEALALISADNAQTQEALALISANNAQTQEARAQNLLVTSEAQGTQIALEVTNVSIAQATAVYNEQQALGQSLAVNAELAIRTGNYDLAFALALESYSLRPDLTQAQRVLNQIVYSSARFSFDDNHFAAFTPDSQNIIVDQGDDLVMWAIATREEVRRYEGHSAPITDAVLSVDGTRLLSSDSDGLVILWNTATGEILHTYQHEFPVGAVAINNDNTRILSGDESSLVIQWDARGDSEIFRYQNVASRPIRRLRFSPDNRNFFVWSDNNPDGKRFMGLWSLSSGSRIYEVDDQQAGQEAFVKIADRTGYAYADETSTIAVYQSSNRATVREIRDRINFAEISVGARAFNESGNKIMVVLENKERGTGQVVYYDIGNGGELIRLQNVDEQYVGAVAISSDERFTLTGDLNELVLWNMDNGREIRRLSAHNDDVIDIQFSDNGQYALSRDRTDNVRVWDIAATEIVEVGRIGVRTQIADIRSLGFASNSANVIAGLQTSIFDFSVDNLQQTDRVDPGGRISNLVFNPVEPQILAVLERGTRLISADQLQFAIRDLYGSVEGETFSGAAAFSPDGTLVTYVSNTNIYVRTTSGNFDRVATIAKSDIMETFTFEVTDIEITPDNTRLVVVVNSTTDEEALSDVMVIDIATGEVLLTLEDFHRRRINDIAVSPDGSQLVTAAQDNDIYLWALGSGAVQRRFVGHTESVNSVKFSPDGGNLLSIGDDTAVILWDVATSQEVRRFRGHIAPVKVLGISPNGRYAATSSGSNEMIIWRISGEEDVVAWAEENRHIPALSCIERLQYNVEPLCDSPSASVDGG